MRHPTPGDQEALRSLKETAISLRQNGNHFGAAYAMEQAAYAAWGDPSEMETCALSALEDYRKAAESGDPCSPKAITAGFLSIRLFWRGYLFGASASDRKHRVLELLADFAQHLFSCFEQASGRDNYLVSGFIVESDFEELFVVDLPPYEVDWNVSTGGQIGMRFQLPSAFNLCSYLGDHELAQQIINTCPDAFTSPGLRGWKAAVEGIVNLASAPERFEEAADAFAEDQAPKTEEEFAARGGHWSNINVETWAPHFRVRALLAAAVRSPSRAKEFIDRAAEAADPDAGGRTAPNVRRLALLVRLLADLLKTNGQIDVESVRQDFLRVTRMADADDGDEVAIRFLTLAAEAFDGFRQDPVMELTRGRLHSALEALRRLPFLDPGVSEAIVPAMGEHAKEVLEGPVRTWMYRALEAITDERELQILTLRLSQASLPLYAQVLHGPLEYGKDVAVYFEQDGERVLRMYQVKVGDISLADWRDIRGQLEEMYLVPVATISVPADPSPRREGILICNGYARPNAQPAMDGWFETQRQQLGRDFQFMGIDAIVQWIEREQLVNEFRVALRDLGRSVEG